MEEDVHQEEEKVNDMKIITKQEKVEMKDTDKKEHH